MDLIPELGANYRFQPSGFEGSQEVNGKVIFISYAHRFFTVAFQLFDHELTESIKF